MVEHITQKFLDSIKLPTPTGKKLKYLMVMPRLVTNENITCMYPYGFCIVSSALKASGRTVLTINLNYKKDVYALLEQMILEHDIDVVATGGLSGEYLALREILDAVKRIKPSIITMVGGGIVTAEPLVALEALENADYGMIGEGEITINALAYALENDEDPAQVAGVVVKGHDYSNGGILTRPEIEDLDMLPFPDYDGFEFNMMLQKKASNIYQVDQSVTVATGRSCPFNCTFCFHSSGKKYRKRSVENVLEELDWLVRKYGVRGVVFVDELFVIDDQYLNKLTDGVKKRNLTYYAQMRVDMVNREKLQRLKDTGCYLLSFGVESADDHILGSMQKKITVAQITQAFQWAKEVGLSAYGNLIFGDPEETMETIQNSLNWWKEHPDFNINMTWILTFPGSALYHLACQRRIISDRVQYLRENKMQLNLSKLSDEEYWKMVKNLELYHVLLSDNVDVTVKNLVSASKKLKASLENMLSDHKIAVWPATNNNISMLNNVSPEFIAHENVTLINARPQDSMVIGARRYGKEIYAPDEAFADNKFDVVLYAHGNRITTEHIYHQICEICQKSYPSVKRVIKLSELLESGL